MLLRIATGGCRVSPSVGGTALGTQTTAAVIGNVSWLPSYFVATQTDVDPGICQTSESSTSYLSSAVACAVSSCKADESDIELVLGPLELYCDAIGCTIPAEVVEDAYAAVSSTADSPKPTHAAPTTKPAAPKPTTTTQTDDHDDAGADLTSAISTTITKTSTDGDGNTLQIIVPIVMGPTQISTGSIITSTVASGTPVSTISSPSPSAQPSAPVPTPGASFTQTSSASGSEETDAPPPPANGNGSPFENMQAGAGRWTLSTPGMALGAFAALVVRM